MAESEEAKQKSQHELRLSKAFDEAVKLSAPTAGESQRQHTPLSTRSLWSSITTGPVFDAPGPIRRPDVDHDFSSDDEGHVFPHISHPTSATFSLAGLEVVEPEDELDGVPVFGVDEEEEEEWNIALPKMALGDVESDRESAGRPDTQHAETQDDDQNSTDIFFDAVSLSKVTTASEEASQTAEYRLTLQGESHLSTNHSLSPFPEKSLDEGSLNRSTAGGSSRQERSENVFQNPAMGDREEPPISPVMNIKDEPIDEGYDCALLPSTRSIKEELDNTAPEEELRISSVFSVGGGNSYGSSTGSMAASQNTTSIFGPGRSLVPQGPTMSLRSLAPVPHPPPPQPQPQAPSSSNQANAVRVSCSGCSKILLRGQTAFQRKGSTQLFCSTVCLTGFTLPAIKLRTCYQCLKEIEDPKDVISVITDNNLKDFCSQFCLSVFNRRRKPGPLSMPSVQEPATPRCTMCKKSDTIQHEVTHQGALHKLCSDECFMRFRSSHNLVINVCESCGEYCASAERNCLRLRVEGVTIKFCSPTCISTYKQTTTKVMPCGRCRDLRLMSDMLESTDSEGKVELFCNSICVNKSWPQNELSGTAFPCTYCKVKAVSQYHLAMVDGSIRNFCSYTCVKTFREVEGSQPPPQQGQMNGSLSTDPPPPAPPQGYFRPYPPSWVPTTGHPYAPTQTSAPPLPYGAAPDMARAYGAGQHQPGPPMPPPPSSSTSTPKGHVKLSCHQCPQQFRWKPELYEYNGRTMQFCSKPCCVEFKKQSNVIVRCEYCKLEKLVKEVIKYDLIDRPFCSESCKLLFKHDMKGPWRMCAYCADISPNMIHNHFGGKMQEFCSEACMSNYTVLFYEMAKCECCRRQGKMKEQLKCFGAVKLFCTLECVIQFCYQTFQQHPWTSNGTTATQGPSQTPFPFSKPAPVIADVVSLATSPAGQPHATAATALTGALPTSNSHGKSLGDASTQTEAMRISARRRIMKNKAVICKPLMLDQQTSCQIQTQTTEKSMTSMGFAETGFTYTENGEKVQVIVMPVPVPVFIPVPMNLYSQYTPVPMGIPVPVPVPIVIPPSLSRSELKDRKDDVPSQTMPEQDEEEKDKPVSHGDQSSAYSGDLESEAMSTPHSWGGEDESTSTSNPQRGAEKSSEHPSTAPSSPSMLDLEADYPPDSFDSAAVKGQRLTVKIRRRKRPRDGFPPSKRSCKRSGTIDMVEHTVSLPPARSKLHHKYGVKAWKNWVLQRNKQIDCEFSKDASAKSMVVKENVLQCNSSELSYGLCHFISEVRRPNGQAYPADSIFYLCLGIQQYLFENGRLENIFTDVLYHKFSMEITMMLHYWSPTLLPSGYLHSRVEEEYLWDCKQLGAYSPIVLLNTLLFFGTKLFQFKTLGQHRRLSFTNFTRCTRVTKNGKSSFLRFRAGQDVSDTTELLALPAKRRLDEEGDMEMHENTENPLRCPVRLYEFYLSKCSESVKNRPHLFYLQPELSCHSNSLLWYSGQQLEGPALESMLTRILAVREVHLDELPLHNHYTEASAASTDDDNDRL